VQNLVFGGQTSAYNHVFGYSAKGTVTLAPNPKQHPILPIANMNFTGSMDGWTTSQAYTVVKDAGAVANSPEIIATSNEACPSPASASECFQLQVTNDNAPASTFWIAKVSVLADPHLVVPAVQQPTADWGPNPVSGGSPPLPVGNNITWISAGLAASAIIPGASWNFTWSATLPTQTGTYYNTIVVSWINTAILGTPFTDTAIATVSTTVTSPPSVQTGTSTATIIPGATSPSGVSAGYDGNALLTSSESGPGSLYVDFKPSFDSVPITQGQQLTSTVSFQTSFSLDSATTSSLVIGSCCTLTWASSLDGITAPRNSLVMYQAYLTNPNGVIYELPLGGTHCDGTLITCYYVNPTTDNDFYPSGWVSSHVPFDPSATAGWTNLSGAWFAGSYTLTISITMTLPGQAPLGSGYPPGVSIHVDDVGLALKPLASTYYGSATFQIPTGLSFNQVQGLEVGVNATGATQNTTIYTYVADNSRFVYNPVLWVQVGSASFSNAGTVDSVSPLPNAAYYLNYNLNSTQQTHLGKSVVGLLDVRVNATSSVSLGVGSYPVNLVVWAVIQTFNQTQAVVEFKNLGSSSVNLLNVVITGPGGGVTSSFAQNFYLSSGQEIVLPENLNWLPGQIYTVTVTTTSGETFAHSFTAPLS
jgi:hypothetical protein